VPLSDAARAAIAAAPALLETVLTGGDDYEIVLTLAPEKLAAFRAAAQAAGVPVTEIGRMQAGEGARFIHQGKALTLARPSYSHF
jgi:thiamine-monophosphate kinase